VRVISLQSSWGSYAAPESIPGPPGDWLAPAHAQNAGCHDGCNIAEAFLRQRSCNIGAVGHALAPEVVTLCLASPIQPEFFEHLTIRGVGDNRVL